MAPHNMYTKMSGLDKYMAKLDKKNLISKAGTDKRSIPDKTESDLPAAQAIRLPVSTGIFEVSYHYDTASKTYQRFQGGEAHQDREKVNFTRCSHCNQVNQKLSADGNHMDKTTGAGKAYIFPKTAKSKKEIGPNQMHKQISASPTVKETKSRSSRGKLG